MNSNSIDSESTSIDESSNSKERKTRERRNKNSSKNKRSSKKDKNNTTCIKMEPYHNVNLFPTEPHALDNAGIIDLIFDQSEKNSDATD